MHPERHLKTPFSIAPNPLLMHMTATAPGLQPGGFVRSFGDAHLDMDHPEQARFQLSRESGVLPKLRPSPSVRSLFDDIAIGNDELRLAIEDPVTV